jgi:RimK family alpha-L-glutamate ligase
MIVLLLTNKRLGYEARRLKEEFESRGHYVDHNVPTATPDVVLARQLGKRNPSNLYLALHYHGIGVRVINTPQSAILAKNKYDSGKLFQANNLPVPRTEELTTIDQIKSFEYPVIVKVLRGSQGHGVYLCHNRKEVESKFNGPDPLIIQEYISACPGEDLRVFVVGGRVVGVMHRQSANGDFRANISQGGRGQSYTLTPEIETLALTASRVVGLEICGVDLLFDHSGFKVCEINASPGFRGFDEFCQSDMARVIVDYIEQKCYTV